jgi:hypothetical protein
MFERNKIDNAAERQMMLVPAEVTLDGEGRIAGKFVVPGGRTLFQVLNGADAFLEFEPCGEARRMVAKASIRNVTLATVPAAGQLVHRLREIDTFDPAAILGVAPDCTIETARAAYHRLARRYHPDRFASVELPDEVRDYLAAMAQRLNIAFAALEAADARRRAAAAAPVRTAPVYSSAPRF